jgi:DNA-binding response OmpR family regulator
MSIAPRAVVVLLVPEHRPQIARVLGSMGFDVILTESFDEGRRALVTGPVALLVTQARLGAYNGLHLAWQARLDDPQVAIVLLSYADDRILLDEAKDVGAEVISVPDALQELPGVVVNELWRCWCESLKRHDRAS